jgi:hypothetical protein
MLIDIQVNTRLNLDANQQILKNLEVIKPQKDLLDEVLQAFKNAPKSTSDDIIKKANKFEVIKNIFLIKDKLKVSHDIQFELKQIANYINHSYTDKFKVFLLEDFKHFKSNQELLTIIKKLENNKVNKRKPNSYYQTFKFYLSQLVKVKTTATHKEEKKLKLKLAQMTNAVLANNFTIALDILNSLIVNNIDTEELKKSLQTRVQFESYINALITDLVQND